VAEGRGGWPELKLAQPANGPMISMAPEFPAPQSGTVGAADHRESYLLNDFNGFAIGLGARNI
jgi:hypothetical protein